jgi:hypothetical protein
MVAITKCGAIPNLTRIGIMPFWYTRAQWKLQFPKDAVYKADITWANIKKSAIANDHVRYCPSWVAPRKKGRPKKEARTLGIADHVQQGVQKGIKKRRRQNTVVHHQTIVEGVDENQAGIQHHGNIEMEDTKDGIVGCA